jgi:hypothetical protein
MRHHGVLALDQVFLQRIPRDDGRADQHEGS